MGKSFNMALPPLAIYDLQQKSLLEDENAHLLENWLAQNPDLNVSEILWWKLKVGKRTKVIQ